jgi:hypothetical protein
MERDGVKIKMFTLDTKINYSGIKGTPTPTPTPTPMPEGAAPKKSVRGRP